MGVTLYHFAPSAPSRGALLAANAVEVDVDVQIVNLFEKEQLKPDFVKLNPQHVVPTLVDGDFVVWESSSIAAYLANAYGKNDSLYPKDLKKRSIVDQRLNFNCGTLYPRIRTICFPVLFLGEVEIFDEHKTALDEALGFLDVFLEDNNFVCGDTLTIADCLLVASVSTIVSVGWDITPYSNVNAWVSKCALEIPNYSTVNQEGADRFGKVVQNMNQYSVLGRIGEGAHGYVMKGVNKITNMEVALKKLIIKNLDEGIPINVMREISSLKVLNSQYIVQLIEIIPHGMGFVLVMEYLPSSLYDVLRDIDNPLNTAQIKCYLKMLLLGVKYMHKNSIMHRDLKPANLLIAHDGILKIGDFGLARIYSENEPNRKYSHQVATRWYRAPELLYGSYNYTTAIDMWSVGCIMAELFNKTPLFPGETDIEQLAIVIRTLGTPSEESWPGLTTLPDYNKILFTHSSGLSWNIIIPDTSEEVVDLIRSFLQYNYCKRLNAKEALNHAYFFINPKACNLDKMPKPENIKECKMPTFEEFL